MLFCHRTIKNKGLCLSEQTHQLKQLHIK